MHHAVLADIGVPMIFVQWPLMLCALVPVIAIEAEVTRRQLALPYRKALVGAAKANLLSTMAGVPLAWFIMFVVELITAIPLSVAAQKFHWHPNSPLFYVFFVLGIAWTGPVVRSAWPIALAAALLLIPTFFVSVRLERRSYRRSWPDVDRATVDRSTWFANVASYSLLFAAACGWLGCEIHAGGSNAPAVKRLIQEHPIDIAYLHDVAIPSCDAASRAKLVDAVAKLEACLADFEALMHDVEEGKIAVWKNLSRGRWQSFVEKPDSSTYVNYTDRVGPVETVQKHANKNPDSQNYLFTFNNVGYITRADMPLDGFDFDDHGRLRHWHGDKADYWGNPIK